MNYGVHVTAAPTLTVLSQRIAVLPYYRGSAGRDARTTNTITDWNVAVYLFTALINKYYRTTLVCNMISYVEYYCPQ